jgi:hypothetical protein
MKRLLSVVIAMVALPLARPVSAQGPFADVPPRHWAGDALTQLNAQGIFAGYPDGLFRGDLAMTRYEVAIAIQRLLQDFQRHDFVTYRYPPAPIPGPPATDVANDHWAGDAVRDLYGRGIETGLLIGYPDRTFAGNRPMTRKEFAVVLQRLHEWLIRFAELNTKQHLKEGSPVTPPAPAP